VLFDLDGTLIDSLADIADAANRVLVSREFPPHPRDAYRGFIGEGVPTLFARALPEGAGTPERIAACAEGFRAEYADAWHAATRVYDGIPELLDAIVARGLKLAVLSNKPDAFTKDCVRHYLDRWPFAPVYGDRAGVARKPDPAGALAIAAELGCAPGAVLYVGDSSVDMTTARRAGMPAAGVSWGFRSADELREHGAGAVIDHPAELLPILDGTRPLRAAD
jgi:phosphoglycolate phosphatase